VIELLIVLHHNDQAFERFKSEAFIKKSVKIVGADCQADQAQTF
jgi:hypothetical protein